MADGVLLFTEDAERTRREITAVGGRVTQQFTERVLVAVLPETVEPESLVAATVQQPDSLDPASELAAGAWRDFQAKLIQEAAPSETEGVSWDAGNREPPDRPEDLDPTEAPVAPTELEPQRSTGTPTSLYMTGSVGVGVVIVSGTADFQLTPAEQQTVIQEVQEGLDFLANAEPRAQLSFIYDIRPVTVSAAPGSTVSYESAESPWRNEALGAMGFAASRQGSIDYVNDLKQRLDTNWAFVAYFTKYPLRHFAYAVAEKTVMHFDNDGWGTSLINRVFAHETCHIFGAADEYGSCGCGESHGYLSVPNSNCVNCPGTQLDCLMSGNVLQMCEWSRGQIGWDERLFPSVSTPLASGTYSLRQKSSGRHLAAHESSSDDFAAMTRDRQSTDSQRWGLTHVGTVYTIQQAGNARFLDAYTTSDKDHSVVTRTAQNNDTQRWVLMAGGDVSTYTIQQLHNGRFLDAWETSARDFDVVTRSRQSNDSQRWIISSVGENTFTIQHRINGRFLEAYESSANDFSAVTRDAQDVDTQRWVLTPVGGVYSIQQISTGRFLDAYTSSANDHRGVTRPVQSTDTQRWVVQPEGEDFTIQQLVNGRYLDAFESSGNDYAVVTRGQQNNDTQRWLIEAV
jgi:hypothetical protein